MKNTFTVKDTPRVSAVAHDADPRTGTVRLNPTKALWFATHATVALIGGAATLSPATVGVGFVTTVVTLCLGHSVGFHRLIVHRSFECPKLLEYALVHLGTLVGMGGPLGIVRMHDIRDWAQRHEGCHDFYIDAGPVWRDAVWQLFCEMKLDRPPVITLEPRLANDPVHRFMDTTWMLQQAPLAIVLFLLGGWAFVIWGISVRITVSLLGHWFVGYLAHNTGDIPRHMEGYGVQGRNVPGLGLLTMGESHHNNHHAFPDSAKLGLEDGQADPGWWFIRLLAACGLASAIHTPGKLETRGARNAIPHATCSFFANLNFSFFRNIKTHRHEH